MPRNVGHRQRAQDLPHLLQQELQTEGAVQDFAAAWALAQLLDQAPRCPVPLAEASRHMRCS
eukprot:8040986-Alexandrium_andersonii.AAC.1